MRVSVSREGKIGEEGKRGIIWPGGPECRVVWTLFGLKSRRWTAGGPPKQTLHTEYTSALEDGDWKGGGASGQGDLV